MTNDRTSDNKYRKHRTKMLTIKPVTKELLDEYKDKIMEDDASELDNMWKTVKFELYTNRVYGDKRQIITIDASETQLRILNNIMYGIAKDKDDTTRDLLKETLPFIFGANKLNSTTASTIYNRFDLWDVVMKGGVPTTLIIHEIKTDK